MQGLPAAFAEHRQALLRFLTARTGSAADAEDLCQDLWSKIETAQPGPVANPRAYLFQMANRLVLDRHRTVLRRMARERLWLDHVGSHDDAANPDRDPDAEAQMIARQSAAALASAIANLPEGARRVLILHKVEGVGHSEIATRLGISRSGVEKHMAVAMRHLKTALAD